MCQPYKLDSIWERIFNTTISSDGTQDVEAAVTSTFVHYVYKRYIKQSLDGHTRQLEISVSSETNIVFRISYKSTINIEETHNIWIPKFKVKNAI